MTRSQLESATLGDIVARDMRAGAIFDRYGLDYCCGGARSLAQGCAQRGVEVKRVLADLEALDPGAADMPDDDPERLIDYIVTRHHGYIRTVVPVIQQHLAKVVAAHRARHPELPAVQAHFDTIAADLMLHMRKEEQVLFPYIRGLARATREDATPPPDMFGTVQNPIRMMEIEHQEAGEGVALIHDLTDGYVAPSDACVTYRVLLDELSAFEEDLHRHVHLENNVLFPKAIELEETIDRRGGGLKTER